MKLNGALSGIGSALGTIKAAYEAARWSPNRAIIRSSVSDVVVDQSDSVRRILIGKCRYLVQNSPFIHGMVERMVTLIIGNGISPTFASSDDNWNGTASKSWETWCKYADATSRASFQTLQQVIVRAMIVDGEIFVLLTFSASGRPRVQLIEAHRVKRIDVDSDGRPTRYVLNGKDDQTDGRKLAADSIVHFFRPERAGQVRGIPLLASAINTAQDVDEILGIEKAAVKVNGTVKSVLYTKSGEMPRSLINGSAAARGATSGTDTNYRNIIGPEDLVFQEGNKYEQPVSQRPSAAWQGFVDFLSETLCASSNFPPSVILQIKVGGVDTRRDLATAQRVAEQWQQDITTGVAQISEYVVEQDTPYQPADYRVIVWEYPRAITADAGRQAQQDREDVKMGTLSLSEFFGQYGVGWKKGVEQLMAELAYVAPWLSERERQEIIVRRFWADAIQQPQLQQRVTA